MPETIKIAVYDLVGRNAKTIGVIVPNLHNPFITSALKGIQKMMSKRGYEMIITLSSNTRSLFNREPDGLLVSISGETNPIPFKEKNIPVVFFDCVDNAGCGFLATEHLVRQGCRRIAIFTPDVDNSIYGQRYNGFRNALEKYSLPFSDELLITARIDIDGRINPADLILQMRPLPDGLFITSDLAAALCMHALKEKGIRIPDDIAIVGCNNDPVGRLVSPALTTIDYPGFESGRTAASNLLHLLSRKKTRRYRTTSIVPPTLIVRGSSLKNK